MAPAGGSLPHREGLLERLLHWLRSGYPEGIPQHDYVALFGILHRELTPQEVEHLADRLHEGSGGLDSAIPRAQIAAVIAETVHEDASEADINRVAGRLAAGGWPLAPASHLDRAPAKR